MREFIVCTKIKSSAIYENYVLRKKKGEQSILKAKN
jgi:hypothetical protein